jgi:hypothetical protein
MSPNFHNNIARTAGALLGLGLALAFLVTARPGANASPLPAAIRVAMAPTGELAVTPAFPRPVLSADALLPGRRPAHSSFLLRNQTSSPLAIGLRATASSTALDGSLRLKLTAGGKPLADTTLQGMKQGIPGLDLSSGEQSRLRLTAWIPSDVLSGYEGRRVNVSLVPAVRIAGGRG